MPDGSGNDVAQRVERIKECFLSGRSISSDENNLSNLKESLEQADPEFRSVAFEGAAMELALSDLAHGGELTQWRSLANGAGKDHATQVHVGLGWALAQDRVDPSSYLKNLDVLFSPRVLDGYGYYDGLFRSRNSITHCRRGEFITADFFQPYDIGIGRSLWYRYPGEPSRIKELITVFPQGRHSDLWTGIGIACVYVGGFSEELLQELALFAGGCQAKIRTGAALAIRARVLAKSFSDYDETACRFWCNRSVSEVMECTVNAESILKTTSDRSFKTWLIEIETRINLS